MTTVRTIRMGVVILVFAACAAAQDDSGTAPSPAFGQSAPVLNPDNPPISGLDEPSLDLKTSSRSFISPAIQIGESADTNENNRLGASSVQPVSHVLGALDLQKFWPRSDLIAEYLGGGVFQTEPTYRTKQLEALGLEAVTRWRTGYLELRDAFNYIPDGSFEAGTAGGFPGFGIAFGVGTGEGLPGIMRLNGTLESVGDIPRLSNTAVANVVQAISPRAAVTLVGAFGNSHFYHNDAGLINSDETTVEAGYSRLVSRRDQVAAVFAYQLFRFPYNTGGEVYNYLFNLRWSRTIRGRMRLVVGAGPQYTELQYGETNPTWSLNGRATFNYRFQRSSFSATWTRYATAGTGFYAGENIQAVLASYHRSFGRTFSLITSAGYVRNTRLQSAIGSDFNFNSDNEGTATVVLRKHLGRTFDVFGAYSFDEVAFDVANGGPNCAATIGCGTTAQRHRGTIGLEWHPKPTRIE